ncbi:MAG: general secretion pathway protein GspK [Verrucomicrobiales bacterium]|nr:general secretion pathway protein GspK [Verrucomicrobiales bacterium]
MTTARSCCPPGARARFATARGTILIVVLWVSLGLVTVTLLFGHAMMLSFRAADNTLANTQAAQAVEAGVRYAEYLLANLETPGELPAEDTYPREYVPVGEGAFWFLSRSGETGTQRQRVFALNDECAKLNLNTATLEMLEALPNMTAEFAASIIDWRDEDEEPQENGAESQYYGFLDPPYRCKNAPFESVEELRWVAHATYSILYGEDANRNGLLDDNENDGDASWPPDDQDGVLDEGIIEYVTVYSREPNTDDEGSARININSGQEELTSLLQETFGDQRAQEITGRLAGNQNLGSVLEFYIRSGLTADEFSQIDDQLTASEDDPAEGLIDVNTASAVVLACLPGMDEQKADTLVAHRRSSVTDFASLAWVAEVLEEDVAFEVGPYLTARTYQVCADVVGVGRLGRGYSRSQVIIDVSGEAPQIVYRKDLSGSGWSLGGDTMQQLAQMRQSSR